MGLLRGAGRFLSGARDALGERLGEQSRQSGLGFMPITSSLTGSAVGGALGAAADQSGGDGGLAGASLGAGVGAGLLGARSLGRLAGTAVMGGLRELGEAQRIARAIRAQADKRGPGIAEAYVRQLRVERPEIADEVMEILTREQPY